MIGAPTERAEGDGDSVPPKRRSFLGRIFDFDLWIEFICWLFEPWPLRGPHGLSGRVNRRIRLLSEDQGRFLWPKRPKDESKHRQEIK